MISVSPSHARLPPPCREEGAVVARLRVAAAKRIDWPAVVGAARPWVQAVRDKPAPFWALESLLQEYPISSREGLALMRLAEALLRVPDAETAIALTADQLGRADFNAASADERSGSPHRLIASLSGSAIALSKRFLPDAEADTGLLRRLGAQTVVAATVRAIQLLGRQFVLGRSIGEALGEAGSARKQQPGLRFSYDMLGEGARTELDAGRYLASYADAIGAIGRSRGVGGPEDADGISIKLSALFSRYEEAQRGRVFAELVPRLRRLVDLAAAANLTLTIDAEESDRLELSLDVFEALARAIAGAHPQWHGFGLAVQAYQTRAVELVDEVARIGRDTGLRFMVRLVKGAYWDGEIKRAQEMGLAGYPVFTEKAHTDVAYLACAAALLGHDDVIYAQFATHNAGTIAAILQMAANGRARFEMQRLHGMGEGIYREVSRYLPSSSGPTGSTSPAQAASPARRSVPLRVYAPVGEHRDLLAYLVRRLLENGANSSFVHQLSDASVDVEALLASPLTIVETASPLPLPVDLYRTSGSELGGRANSRGLDLASFAERESIERAIVATRIEPVAETSRAGVEAAVGRAVLAFLAWNAWPVGERVALLRRAADMLEARLPEFCGVLVAEAGKTQGDCVAEVREAVDFCRYYADEAERRLVSHTLPGPTGESNELHLHGRGVFACISPWNFPLAIFSGQVVAALVTGNSVVAKPAEQTPVVAARMVALLHEAGLPADALSLVHGPGETIGAALVADPRIGGVCFTGSLPVAQSINRTLAARRGAIVPLIAETGGVNAMIVDSSALPEQVVDAVVQSAFRSAGQRCSALRLLCVHESIADAVIEMVRGALAELRVGDPARYETDVGPLIDADAWVAISSNIERLRGEARCVGEAPLAVPGTAASRFVAPVAFELPAIEDVKEEIFGPVLHIVRWRGDVDAVIGRINALGYGLTLGIQTRIDSRALRLAHEARIGNVYINRNMIGAVVGVQPFGGEGLSGTGPKAGGPHYLRFCTEQVVTINTAAAGGNAALLAGLP
jgi:RHH-type proline utilization regulon transcriptional repressor/proline dehydrogenase/delta 1-pyrroline-5-carboxylate dehydrogenase